MIFPGPCFGTSDQWTYDNDSCQPNLKFKENLQFMRISSKKKLFKR